MLLARSSAAPFDDKLRTVHATPLPSKEIVPPFSTLCRGAVLFSIVFSLIVVAAFPVYLAEPTTAELRIDKSDRFYRSVQIYDWFRMMRSLSATAAAHSHSIAKALETIATGLLSPALDKVTRPKLMVRPRRTTRASASTSDDVTARMKCVV